MDTSFLANYFEPYVDKVWERFANEDITIDTMAAGVLKGRVIGDKFVIGGQEFSKPTTKQIFSASGDPFQTGVNSTRDAIIPRLDAEFNRSTLMMHIDIFPGQPDQYYKNHVTNHYVSSPRVRSVMIIPLLVQHTIFVALRCQLKCE
jgi:Beta-1,3-glucanase